MNDANALVKSVDVTRVIQARETVVSLLERVERDISEALTIIQSLTDEQVPVHRAGTPDGDGRFSEKFTHIVDQMLWNYFIKKSGIRTIMDATSRRRMDDDINNNRAPALTAENVRATLVTLYEDRGAMFDRGVLEVYRRLSWDYKSNRGTCLRRKIIVHGLMDRWGFLSSTVNAMDDLERVHYILDGRPAPDHRQAISAKVREATIRHETSYEDEYFYLRWYQNGNGHLTFKRQDLLDKMNKILHKHYPDAISASPSQGRAR